MDIREKIAFSEEELIPALENLRDSLALEEIAILSTCNRTKSTLFPSSQSESIKHWLASSKRSNTTKLGTVFMLNLQRRLQIRTKSCQWIRFPFSGESQVLGQFKNCFHVAGLAGTLGRELKIFLKTIFRLKRLDPRQK